MATTGIEEALAWCLEALERGTHTRKECLERYPVLRAELEPLLSLVADLRAMPYALPSVDFRLRLRSRLQARARAPFRRPQSRVAPGIGRRLARRATAWASVGATLVALFATAGVASASADALPGDWLYPAKLMVEAARELLTFDPQAQAELQLDLAENRLEELEALAEAGRLEDVDALVLAFEYHWAAANSVDGEPGVGLGIGQIPPGFEQHIQVLLGVYDRAPEAARPALLRVLTRSVEALSGGPGRSGEAPGHQEAGAETSGGDEQAQDPPPGQSGETGNPHGTPPGQSDDRPGPQATPPGQSGGSGNPHGTPPGQPGGSGNPHGTPPGQADK